MFGSWDNAQAVKDIIVRSTKYFNWSTIFFIAVVVFIYGALWRHKEYKLMVAGISLYSVHWLCRSAMPSSGRSGAILCGRAPMTQHLIFF